MQSAPALANCDVPAAAFARASVFNAQLRSYIVQDCTLLGRQRRGEYQLHRWDAGARHAGWCRVDEDSMLSYVWSSFDSSFLLIMWHQAAWRVQNCCNQAAGKLMLAGWRTQLLGWACLIFPLKGRLHGLYTVYKSVVTVLGCRTGLNLRNVCSGTTARSTRKKPFIAR